LINYLRIVKIERFINSGRLVDYVVKMTMKNLIFLNLFLMYVFRGSLVNQECISFISTNRPSIRKNMLIEQVLKEDEISRKNKRRINYNGLEMELSFQDSLYHHQNSYGDGINLIVLTDNWKGTGLYIGNIELAAKTLSKKLKERTIIKKFYKDVEFFSYLANTEEKIARLFWFGHGDAGSLWLKRFLADDNSYIDEEDFNSINTEKLEIIRRKFLPNAIFKLYTCHGAADNSYICGKKIKPIGKIISEKFNVDVVAANSWVFAKGIKNEKGEVEVYYYPATREDYATEFLTSNPDNEYTGKSRWVLFKKPQ